MKNLIAIVLEEAQNIFGISRVDSFLQNPLNDFIRRIRSKNVSMWIINQTVTTLSTTLRSNVYIQFMLGATNAFERTEMGRSIGLEEAQWFDAKKLDQPYAFISVEGKKPRLMYIPKYNEISGNENTSRFINSSDDLPFMPVSSERKKDLYNRIFLKQKVSINSKKKSRANPVLEKIKELLLDIAKRPFIKYTKRKTLSYSKSKSDMFSILNKAREMKLVRLNYTKISKGRGGQKGLYLELTTKGMDFLVDHNLWKDKTPYYQGKMGFFSALILNELLVPYYRDKGYETHVEGVAPNDCDLGLIDKDGNKAIAVELSVTTSAAHEAKANIERNLSEGWPKVITVVVGVKQNEEKIEESEIATKQKLKAFKEFFKENLSLFEQNRVTLHDLKPYRKAK